MNDILSPGENPEREQKEETFSMEVPIEWYVPDNLVSGYATNMTLQRTEHEFTLSFYEQRMPVFVGSPEEVQAQAKQLTALRATCFARVIISPGRFPDFMKVLQRALGDLEATQEENKS